MKMPVKWSVGSGPGWAIRCGDALSLLPDVRARSFDMVCADPPYSSGGLHRGDRQRGTIAKYGGGALSGFDGDAKDQRSFEFWSTLWMSLALRALKQSGYLVVWTDHRQLGATQNAMQAAGVVARGIIVWDKVVARPPGTAWFTPQAEFAVWGTRGAVPTSGPGPFPGVIRCPAPHHTKRIHPCEKPQEVLRHLLAPLGGSGSVLDPFAGSGSCGEAARSLGLNYLGFELAPGYALVAKDLLSGVPRETIRARLVA